MEIVPEFEKIAKQVKDFIKVGAVNVDKETIVTQQLNIDTYPSIALVLGFSKPEIISGGNSNSHYQIKSRILIIKFHFEFSYQN